MYTKPGVSIAALLNHRRLPPFPALRCCIVDSLFG